MGRTWRSRFRQPRRSISRSFLFALLFLSCSTLAHFFRRLTLPLRVRLSPFPRSSHTFPVASILPSGSAPTSPPDLVHPMLGLCAALIAACPFFHAVASARRHVAAIATFASSMRLARPHVRSTPCDRDLSPRSRCRIETHRKPRRTRRSRRGYGFISPSSSPVHERCCDSSLSIFPRRGFSRFFQCILFGGCVLSFVGVEGARTWLVWACHVEVAFHLHEAHPLRQPHTCT